MTRKINRTCVGLAFICGLACFACGPNENLLRSGSENKVNVAATPRSSFDTEMSDMRTAGFTFIYVLRRKDGGKLDSADRSLIKSQTEDMNRRVSADEDRAVIIGSNYQLPDANLAVLRDKFTLEIVAQAQPVNGNRNANTSK
jgi:hypothetical protein